MQIIFSKSSIFCIFALENANSMEQKTRCIVLRSIKYGDNKLIVDFITRETGRVSAIWKISNSKSAKIRRQFFQPLTILEAEFTRTPRQQMSQLTDARLAETYSSLPFDGTKLSLAFFIAEFLQYATRDMHSDSLLYDFVEQSLLWLDSAEQGIANFHLMFMMRMSLFLGFYPDMDSYSPGCIFDLREGAFCNSVPLHPDFLKPQEAEIMLTLMRMTPANLHLFSMSRTDRNRIIDIALRFYHIHIPAFGEMKTLSILREL